MCCGALCEQMLSEEVRPHASVFVSLLDAQLNNVEAAVISFQSLRDVLRKDMGTGRLADSTALLDECRGAFLRGLCRIGRENEATQIYVQARADGAAGRFDRETVMQLAKLQAEASNIAGSWVTIEDMMKLGHKPSDALLQAFLIACTRQENANYPATILAKMAAQRMVMSQPNYALVFKLYGRCGQLQSALTCFQDMTDRQGVDPAPQTCAALISVCLECQQPERALELLLQMPARCSLAADMSQSTLNALAAAAAARGEVGLAQMQRLREIADAQNLTIRVA